MQIIIDTIIGVLMAVFGVSSFLSHIHDPECIWKSEDLQTRYERK